MSWDGQGDGLEMVGPKLSPKARGRLPERRPFQVAVREWGRSVVCGRGREPNDDWKARLEGPHGGGL